MTSLVAIENCNLANDHALVVGGTKLELVEPNDGDVSYPAGPVILQPGEKQYFYVHGVNDLRVSEKMQVVD